MSAPIGVRTPSQTTGAPFGPKMWNDRFTGFGPAAGHVWLPVFVTVTFTVFCSAQYASSDCVIAYDDAKRAAWTCAGARNVVLPKRPHQPTPSHPRSTVNVYAPAACGVAIFVLIVADVPGATSAPSGVRMPSHTTVFPAASCQ